MLCLLNRLSSHSLRRCYPTLLKANIRSISISRKPKHERLADPSVHKILYTFKYVQLWASFVSTKLYFPLCTGVTGLCVSFYLNSLELVIPIIMSNLIHLTFVNIATKLLDNVVGAVFVNKEGEIKEVIFSSVDAWGRRLDRKHNVDDIIELSENRAFLMAGFVVVAIENSEIRYLVNFKNGQIYDSEACRIVFGDDTLLLYGKKTRRG